jgi:hypothetical protein
VSGGVLGGCRVLGRCGVLGGAGRLGAMCGRTGGGWVSGGGRGSRGAVALALETGRGRGDAGAADGAELGWGVVAGCWARAAGGRLGERRQ